MSRSIANIQYLEAKNLAHWMKSADAPLFQVIDVRGSDYVGGHIKGCWNYPYRRLKVDDGYMEEMYKALNKKLGDTGSDRPLNAIFHCAQSQQRGPAAAMKLLRFLPDDKLSNFKIWVLRGGFNHWQDQYGEDQELTEDYEPDIWSW
ncbi:related to CDC25-like phosphatase YCH1 [Nakaseomyces glabratus]|nr:Rhodanese-like domain [Nakaseomyces glabratus]QNG15430.1 uncharacterized protein GWK60_K00781 [Nakaseomyces glabratus]SCV13788.1 related to CDC25-like phosphatase YCH1 [Nakaseomyces glabratus]SLM12091.1 related to CDC25-like phosphatase YCH1 [Nakaseomyces glabratus]